MTSKARKQLTQDELFFYEHAGYSYDSKKETAEQGRIRCAKAYAGAEQVAKRMGWQFEWMEDQDANANGEYPEATEVLGCIMFDPKRRATDRMAGR